MGANTVSEIVDVTSLIGGAVEQIMAEIAESGSWRDRRKAQWLLAKLETCIANHDEFAVWPDEHGLPI